MAAPAVPGTFLAACLLFNTDDWGKIKIMETVFLHKRIVGPLKGLSLQHRIPLLICLLLFIVVSVFIVISYFSIRKFEAAAGKQRLLSLVTQVSSMLSESINDIVETTAEAAALDPVKNYFDKNVNTNDSEVIAVLNRYAGTSAFEYTLLLNKEYRPVLASQKNSLFTLERADKYMPVIKDGTLKAGNIYQIADTVYYPVVAPVLLQEEIKGYLVRCRQVRVTSKVLEQFSSLAGRGITLFVGNKDGSAWTDLSRPISYQLPESAVKRSSVYEYRQQNGTAIMGGFEEIPGTPWLVSMEVPRSVAFQGSSGFLRWMIVVALLLIGGGLSIAWYMGRNLTRPLNELILGVTALGGGDRSRSVPVHRTDEVGALAQSFNTMLSQLETANRNTREQMQASEQLNEQLRRLSAHLNSVREEERVSIARELHDQLGQVLTAFKMDIYAIRKKVGSDANPVIDEKLKAMEVSVDEGVRFVRKLCSELRAGPLEDLGLNAAVEWYGNIFSQRYHIPVVITSDLPQIELPLPLSIAIFRIFQESLTNVARHAQATKVEVSLAMQDNTLAMFVKDNGKGFDQQLADAPKTLGLLGMKERAIMIDSELHIHSTPGNGCMIELRVPLQYNA